jgi:hypothetical protein
MYPVASPSDCDLGMRHGQSHLDHERRIMSIRREPMGDVYARG